jgi:hemerythrin-like domain-containing protein
MRRHKGLIPLSHDHQHALALCVLTERELGAIADANAASSAAAKIVEAFDEEILDHFEFEEQVLFPMLASLPPLAEIVSGLKEEHTLMRGLIAALRAHGERARILEFCSTLRDHVRKEENVLFERAQELLSDEQLNAIADKRTTR